MTTTAQSEAAQHPDRRPTVLLTGFGPFPGVEVNVSARLAKELAARACDVFPDHHFKHAVLPTEWRAAPEKLIALISGVQPDLVLLFGVAHEARGFRIETEATNTCRAAHDAAGLPPLTSVLVDGAQAAYPATLPVAAIVTRLMQLHIPVSISNEAGGYLCNAALFHALHAAGSSQQPFRAGFIHVPPVLSGPPLTFEQAITGSLEIIRASLKCARV